MLVQVEVAFKEQTAGHNALLLLTHLALRMMKGQLQAAALDVRARQAQVIPSHHSGHPISWSLGVISKWNCVDEVGASCS